MNVRVGSARSDENGGVKNGIAGDQTTFEVSTQDWYLHSKGWVIIRAKDAAVREKIAYAMERACANQNIGYDQAQRSTAFNWCKKANNYDPGVINTPVEVDCSALVRLCCWYAGIQVGSFTTSNEVAVLGATGQFEIIKDERTKDVIAQLRGDILVTATKGHTVVVLDDGAAPKAEPLKVATARGSVKVRTGADISYRALGTVKKGEQVEVLEILDSGWYKVKWDCPEGFGFTSNRGNKYYILEEKVVEAPVEPTPTPAPVLPKMRVRGSLYIRKGPGKQYDAVGILRDGDIIEIAEEVDGWAKLADGRGFSSLKYLEKI